MCVGFGAGSSGFVSCATCPAGQQQSRLAAGRCRKTPEKAPALSAEEEMKTFVLPPGYRVELVAKEPLVVDPIAIDFDADGRLWVLEMPGFMSEPNGARTRASRSTTWSCSKTRTATA